MPSHHISMLSTEQLMAYYVAIKRELERRGVAL